MGKNSKKKIKLPDFNDLMNGKPCTLFRDVQEEINKETNLANPWTKRDKDWSILGHQIVGSEKY